MKRIVLTLTLVLLSLFLIAAEVDTGTITFKGYINPDISFNVTLLSNDSYDLLQELELRPNGVGLNVAEWTLVFGNPPHGGPLYYIQYEYETLKSYTTKDEIEFEIIEKRSGGQGVVKASGDSTLINLNETDDRSFTSIIAVRYTEAGVEGVQSAGAAGDYESNIKVTLLTD